MNNLLANIRTHILEKRTIQGVVGRMMLQYRNNDDKDNKN